VHGDVDLKDSRDGEQRVDQVEKRRHRDRRVYGQVGAGQPEQALAQEQSADRQGETRRDRSAEQGRPSVIVASHLPHRDFGQPEVTQQAHEAGERESEYVVAIPARPQVADEGQADDDVQSQVDALAGGLCAHTESQGSHDLPVRAEVDVHEREAASPSDNASLTTL
jgi:hypothetical protein